MEEGRGIRKGRMIRGRRREGSQEETRRRGDERRRVGRMTGRKKEEAGRRSDFVCRQRGDKEQKKEMRR